MNEIWKEIPGFSRYMVSNTGKLKSMNYKNGKAKKYRVSEANLKDIVSRRRNNWAHI